MLKQQKTKKQKNKNNPFFLRQHLDVVEGLNCCLLMT